MKKLFYIIIALVAFMTAGCFSMKYDFKGGVAIDPKIKTFSVQYFDNKATLVEPTFSQIFTQELQRYIENNTNLRLVVGRGDVDFSGFVSTYQITGQAVTSGETAAKTRFTVGVKVKYSNNINPDDEFDRSFSQFREFESTVSFSDVEETLSAEIREEIIEQIFIAAFVNW
jgi:preprotein translocase subunit SecF